MDAFNKLLDKKIIKIDGNDSDGRCYGLTLYFDDKVSCEIYPTINEDLRIDWYEDDKKVNSI